MCNRWVHVHQKPTFLLNVWGQKGASQVALVVKNPTANAGDLKDVGSIPGSGRSTGGGHGTHSSILAWEIIPWTEEPAVLLSVASPKSWT